MTPDPGGHLLVSRIPEMHLPATLLLSIDITEILNELRPTRESILARNDELRIRQLERCS
jgi:hypothetical protein